MGCVDVFSDAAGGRGYFRKTCVCVCVCVERVLVVVSDGMDGVGFLLVVFLVVLVWND